MWLWHCLDDLDHNLSLTLWTLVLEDAVNHNHVCRGSVRPALPWKRPTPKYVCVGVYTCKPQHAGGLAGFTMLLKSCRVTD